MLALAQVQHDSASGSGDFLQRGLKLKARVADERAEHGKRHVLRVDTDKDGFGRRHVAHDHREMHLAVDDVLESDGAEAPVNGRHVGFDGAAHERLFAYAIAHEVSDRDNLEIMTKSKLL